MEIFGDQSQEHPGRGGRNILSMEGDGKDRDSLFVLFE
jgi:hypothetical protein